MNFRRRIAGLWVVLIGVLSFFHFASNWAEEEAAKNTSSTATETQIRQWVAELGDVRFQVRERATDLLIKAGSAALPVLDEAKASDDREVRERAAQIEQGIVSGAVNHLLSLGATTAFKRKDESGNWIIPKTLHLSGINDADLEFVGCLRSVEKLYCYNLPITDNGLAHLSKLTNLTDIGLRNTKVTDAGLSHLCRNQGLVEIDLVGCEITDIGCATLATFAHLARVSLDETSVSDKGLSDLRKLELTRLNIRGTNVTGAGLRFFSEHTQLNQLWLSGPSIVDDDLRHLSKLIGLASLYLNNTTVTSEGLTHLVHLQNLKTLSLWNTPVTDEAVAHLAKLNSIHFLDIRGTRIRPTSLLSLRDLPKLRLIVVPSGYSTDEIDELERQFARRPVAFTYKF